MLGFRKIHVRTRPHVRSQSQVAQRQISFCLQLNRQDLLTCSGPQAIRGSGPRRILRRPVRNPDPPALSLEESYRGPGASETGRRSGLRLEVADRWIDQADVDTRCRTISPPSPYSRLRRKPTLNGSSSLP